MTSWSHLGRVPSLNAGIQSLRAVGIATFGRLDSTLLLSMELNGSDSQPFAIARTMSQTAAVNVVIGTHSSPAGTADRNPVTGH
jgi:hypothetical protein